LVDQFKESKRGNNHNAAEKEGGTQGGSGSSTSNKRRGGGGGGGGFKKRGLLLASLKNDEEKRETGKRGGRWQHSGAKRHNWFGGTGLGGEKTHGRGSIIMSRIKVSSRLGGQWIGGKYGYKGGD